MLSATLAASVCLGQAALPTIVHFVADDLGYNDLGHTNGNKTYSPHIDRLVADGIKLTSYYNYKAWPRRAVCSPSRAAQMTGRYAWGVGYYDMEGKLAVPLDYTLLPQRL
eukprot:gene2860-3455_t